MKTNQKLLFASITLCSSLCIMGQVAVTTTGGHTENNNRIAFFIHGLSTENTVMDEAGFLDTEEIAGSMYYNEEFSQGQIYYDNKPMIKANMRYNAFTDQVEVKRPNKNEAEGILKDAKVSCLVNNEQLFYMEFLNRKGELEQGYLIPKWKGNNYQLYLKKSKVFKAGQVAKTSLHKPTQDKFVNKTVLFVVSGNSKPTFLNPSKKNIASIFDPGIGSEIKSYVKENKLDLTQLSDLSQLLTFAESLDKS